jgi:hypothetical protein
MNQSMLDQKLNKKLAQAPGGKVKVPGRRPRESRDKRRKIKSSRITYLHSHIRDTAMSRSFDRE